MERICEHGGWDVGHAWLIGPLEGAEIAAADTLWFFSDVARYGAAREMSPPDLPDDDDTLPGRTVALAQPVWISALEEDADFVRSEAFVELGLRSAVSVPLLAGEETVAVLEFFASERRPRDDDALTLLKFVGTILGRAAERHLAARALARSDANLRQVLATAYDAYVAIDESGKVLEWNLQAESTFGWTREEVLGRTLSDILIPPEFRDRHRAGLQRFIETGEERVMRQRLKLPALVKDGGRVPVELTITPLELEDGYLFSAFLQDISDEVAAELERERREYLLSEAQRIAQLGSWEWDIGGDRVTWSDELYKIFGKDPSDGTLDYASYLELLPEDDRKTATEHVERALATQEPFEFEHRVLRPDGSVAHVLGRGRVILGENGSPARLIGTAQDITELRRHEERRLLLERERVARVHSEAMEEEARRGEARYRELADAIPQHVWTAGSDGTLQYMNSVGLDFFGADVETLAAARGEGQVHPDDLQPNLEAWDRAVSERTTYEARLRLRRRDGEYRWHLIRALPQFDEDRKLAKWHGTSTDIHEQVLAESARDRALEELARANADLATERTLLERRTVELAELAEALERSNRELDQFAYVASHDLRAPLRGIGNLTRFLEEDLEKELEDDSRELMELIRSRVGRMEALIDGILTYSRAGRLALEPEWLSVDELLGELLDMLGVPPDVSIEIGPGLPRLLTPRVPLEQVFQNLLSNAFKFAAREEGGRVSIGGRKIEEGWEFWVEDDGPGIGEEFHEKIFQIFQTLHPRDEVEGTGIGLAVVKKIVDARGGTVTVESKVGEGTRFRFTWPDEPDRDESGRGDGSEGRRDTEEGSDPGE